MDLAIRGKSALVTASSGGMGANIARALAREGANIILFARSGDKLRALASEIENVHGVRVLPCAGSMLESGDLDALVSAVQNTFGHLNIAVLNSGRPPSPLRATVQETERARWDESYRTLLAAVIETTHRIHPLMTNGGRIVAISSASVHQPMPNHALSTVFRAGVEAFMKHLAIELGPHRITVNCVAPALIETPHRSGAAAYSPEESERRRRMNMLGRLGTQDELCALITFLVSQQAGFITGETIRIDGGLLPTRLGG